jgi:DNA-binding transcriptional LysR family regulator
MNLKALRAFQLIVERGSLSVASSALGLSQPAVSRLVTMLEEELNLQLFDRSGRALRVTPKGAAFYEGTRHILAGLEQIPQIAKDVQSSDKQFKLLTSQRIAQGVISPTLALMMKELPGLRSTVDVLSRYEVDNLIGMRRFDLAIASLPVSHPLADIENVPVFSVRMEAAMRKDHPLASQPYVTAADLAREDLIGLWTEQLWRQQMNEFMRAGGTTGRYVIETRSSLMAFQIAADGAGITVLDRLSARGFDQSNIVFKPLMPQRRTTFGYIHHRDQKLSDNAKRFLGYLRRTILDFKQCSSEAFAAVELTADDDGAR